MERLKYILQQYAAGTATAEELEELTTLLKQEENDEMVKSLLLEQSYETLPQQEYNVKAVDDMVQQILGARIVPIKKRRFVRIAAAAAVILVLSTTILLLSRNDKQDSAGNTAKQPLVQDIDPGGDRAILTLADGSNIMLDSASNGALAQQGGMKVIKLDGQISYSTEGNSREVLYNTITTPKGGQYQLVLADGSKIWLNAASSLRFPNTFVGKERTVELTGEGYFEVAHNSQMPFHIKVNEMDVEVLGTKFNINSYSDEPTIKTTLLDGKVMVRLKEKHVYLNPGQQAILQPGEDKIRLAYDIDTDEVLAWKNGYLSFNNADLQSVMRQLARWYDVDVLYEGTLPKRQFEGKMPRNSNLSEVLKIIETNNVHMKIQGKKIVVTP